MSRYIPDRGDIVWLRFDPAEGHEQAGHRPAVVLSQQDYNGKIGLALVCPVTSRIKGYPFEVRLPEGLKSSGVVLADHVHSLDWKSREARFIERMPASDMSAILARTATLLM
ncbi:MAG: endoribonuclease MazF [Planctomycetota bacterium]